MITKLLILILLTGCAIERDIKVWNQTLCLERVRTVYRGDRVYYDHVWTDGKIRYTERREDLLRVGDCKTFLVR